MNKWQDAYPELVNKLRWAISTTFSTPDSRYPYQASQALATVFSQDILELVKVGEEFPESLASTDIVRGSLRQRSIVEELDKVTTDS